MPLKNILDEFFTSKTNRGWVQEILKDYLNVEPLRGEDGKQILKRGEYTKMVYNEYADDGNGELEVKVVKWRGRPYVFRREDFIQEEVILAEELVFSENGEKGEEAPF